MTEYLKLPLQFEQFFQKKKLGRCTLSDSISRNIHLLVTTHLEENDQDFDYGSKFWDHDYDIHLSNSIRREMVSNSLREQLMKYEKRLAKPFVDVNVVQKEYRLVKNSQLKRRIEISVTGHLSRNNQPFKFQTSFFIGPLMFD